MISEILNSVSFTLSDNDHVAFPEVNLIQAINNACLQVCLLRPDASSAVSKLPMVEGALQTLPHTALRLLDTYYNQLGHPIYLVNRKEVDRIDPDWLAREFTLDIQEVMYDERFPTVFHVYPPAKAGAVLELGYSVAPKIVVQATDEFPLSRKYVPPVIEWVLYQMYSLEQQSASNQQKAGMHSQQFYQQLQIKTQSDQLVATATSKGP